MRSRIAQDFLFGQVNDITNRAQILDNGIKELAHWLEEEV